MRCGVCSLIFEVDWEWLRRWKEVQEACPTCGTTSDSVLCARPYIFPDDPALDDGKLRAMSWFHTSTEKDWPSSDFDPTGDLTEEFQTRAKRMLRRSGFQSMVSQQKSRALHLGTYEASVYNAYRRISDEGDEGKDFYVYRVELNPESEVRQSWVIDPGNVTGQVQVDKVCPEPIGITRYVNFHEDPGSLSLAVRPQAVKAVQQVAASSLDIDEDLLDSIIDRLREASHRPLLPREWPEEMGIEEDRSPVSAEARKTVKELVASFPVSLSDYFNRGAARCLDQDRLETWARWTISILNLVNGHSEVLEQLRSQPRRLVY